MSVRLLLRRGVTQATLLAAVLAVVVAGCVLLGTCTLLLTHGRATGLDVTLRRADPRDVAVEATARLEGAAPDAVLSTTSRLLTDALAPAQPTVTTWATSAVRPLVVAGAPGAHGYVVAAEGIAAHADLVTGRWPVTGARGPVEVALPAVAAQRLALAPGDEVVLDELRDGRVRAPAPGASAVTMRVVGTFAPVRDASATWDRDLLHGAGSDPAWQATSARPPVPVHGPFVVASPARAGWPVAVDRVSVVAQPDLAGRDGADRAALTAAVRDLGPDLRAALDDPVAQVRVRSDLGRTLAAAATQARATTSTVVVVALLGTALAAAALALASRFVAVRRDAGSRLLVARGATLAQLVRLAAAEGLALALVGAALAVPSSLALYRGLTHLPRATAAGLGDGGAAASPALVGAVAAGALLLAAALVVPAARPADGPRPTGTRGRVARLTVEVLLVGLAVVGWQQLRHRPLADGLGVDPVLVAAPLLCLAAGAAVALRVVPWAARHAEVRAGRSRGLVLPLAAWQVARGGHATGAALLLVLAAAAATFATSLGATWARSAQDQADAHVGTDLAVARTAAPALAQAQDLAALTGADVLPLTDREVALGPADDGSTRLVAPGTTSGLLRGRLPAGTTWRGLTAGLAPVDPVAGIALPSGTQDVRLTVTGRVTDTTGRDVPGLTATPTVVVEAPGGARQTLEGATVPLDGAPYDAHLPLPPTRARTGVQLVAVGLRVGAGPQIEVARVPTGTSALTVGVTVRADGPAGAASAPAGTWHAAAGGAGDGPFRNPGDVTVRATDAGVTLEAGAGLRVPALLTGDADLVLTGFAPPDDVPVVLAADLATRLDAHPGDTSGLHVGGTTLVARVLRVAPPGASVPHGAGVLADHDALSRALVARGAPADVTDGWWLGGVADPDATAAQVADAGLGTPATRAALAQRYREDPLGAGVQLALALLVGAAGLLAVAGTLAQTAAALDARAVDVARLRGAGATRREVVASLVVEHAGVTVLAVAAGGVVGAVAGLAVGPLLVVAPTGGTPVPAPLPVWSWPAQGGLLAALAVVCAGVAVPVAAALVRRATAAHLRVEGAG